MKDPPVISIPQPLAQLDVAGVLLTIDQLNKCHIGITLFEGTGENEWIQ
jgi:hypothetical protein